MNATPVDLGVLEHSTSGTGYSRRRRPTSTRPHSISADFSSGTSSPPTRTASPPCGRTPSRTRGRTERVPKKDYYDDPAAPAANSIVPAVTAIVRNKAGEVLMIERTDNGLWALLRGAQDVGESVTDAVRREVFEETGLRVEVTGIGGSTPTRSTLSPTKVGKCGKSSRWPSTPVRQGENYGRSESRQVHWIAPDHLDTLNIHPSMRARIDHGVRNPTSVLPCTRVAHEAALGPDRHNQALFSQEPCCVPSRPKRNPAPVGQTLFRR